MSIAWQAHFHATQATVTLAALGRMRWDHPRAIQALLRRIAHTARLQVYPSSAAPRAPQCRLTDVAVAIRAASRLPSSTEGPALKDLVALSVDLLPPPASPSEAAEPDATVTTPFETFETGAASGAKVGEEEAVRMAAAHHMRDLGVLCSGLLQIDMTPPAALVEHVAHVMLTYRPTEAPAEQRAERRVRAKLAQALSRWGKGD